MIENVGDAEKMSGQILREIVDKIMHEVVGNEGGWGYVKSENDEINKISKEEINEEIEKNDKTVFDENKEKMIVEDSKSENILVKFWEYFKNVWTAFKHFFF
uniref:Candidate secreted effector n=1 Tax=Meloidogyne incognita TaxID=6306 RepID=A0A914MN61_MELIC